MHWLYNVIVTGINNNAIINNYYYGIFQYFILLVKIPMGTLKDFFEIYTQFVHVSSKNLRQPWTSPFPVVSESTHILFLEDPI